MSRSPDLLNGLASATVLVALLFLFVAGLRLPVARAGWRRWCAQGGILLGAVVLTLCANIALYRHDVHFDVTHERAFTPSPEVQRVVRGLTADVDLIYFYQKQHPAGRLAWLVGEERAPTMKPPIEVLPTVVLTQRQGYGIFAVTSWGSQVLW